MRFMNQNTAISQLAERFFFFFFSPAQLLALCSIYRLAAPQPPRADTCLPVRPWARGAGHFCCLAAAPGVLY